MTEMSELENTEEVQFQVQPDAMKELVLNPEDLESSEVTIMPSYQYLEAEEEDNKFQEFPESQLQCFGYRYHSLKLVLYYFFNVLFLGAPYLFGRWYCRWKVIFQCVPETLRKATIVLLKDTDDNYYTCKVHEDQLQSQRNEFSPIENALLSKPTNKKQLKSLLHSCPVLRNFIFHHEKYIWDEGQKQYRLIQGLDGYTCNDLLRNSQNGHSKTRLEHMRTIYGSNSINIDVKSYPDLLVAEVLNPFYLFQAFSVILWTIDDYVIYAGCVFLISSISISLSLYETRRQQMMIKSMAEIGLNSLITVRRGGEESEIHSKDLVPGDVILIPSNGFTMPCDAIVIEGTCIVNESMLTGESIPVNKLALQSADEIYDSEIFKRNTLFAGTRVIQTRFYGGKRIACVVVKTGFNTQKGQLIRSILFPKEVGLNFYNDAMKFVQFLFGIASIGMLYSIYLYIQRGSSAGTIIVRVLDIVTIVVPPALPAAMTVGIVYAQSRLKTKKIFCISPQRINFCGQLTLICFDKTGTLTEDGLDLWCVVPCDELTPRFCDPIADPSLLPEKSQLVRGMASCHSLTYINKEIVGDPLDLKMFSSTKWELEEPSMVHGEETRRFDILTPNVVKRGGTEMAIIREFEFTPQLQRMSVVVRALDSPTMYLHCKGSPEKVSRLCRAVPDDYDRVLDSFTVKGYRVLALAWKPIEDLHWHQLQRASRDEVEFDLIFGGFLVMQNSLKAATIPIIEELKDANIRSVMVTGDHLLTAISVARECGMISSCDKVVVVHVNEDGDIEFKLAAHHYEPVEPSEELEDENSENNSDIIQNDPPTTCAVEAIELVNHFEIGIGTESEFIRRVSVQSKQSESLIDMDHLVPILILPNNILQTIVDLHESNYHFVLTGRTWDALQEKCSTDILEKILVKGTVFARMSPESKRELIERFQGLGYIVSMCGDGANDCSALKMAHVGISLSEAEASVAAPFTSTVPDISCVPNLIREGRCALVTSFGMFKYMALYSLIQFTSVLILYQLYTNYHDAHFLYVDLGITTTIALVMGRTGPFKKIAPKTPNGRLVSVQNIFSILAQVLLAILIQICAMLWLGHQEWYVPIAEESKNADDIIKLCWETTTILSVTAFQYLIICVVFSVGPPYRKPFYTNALLLTLVVVLSAFTIFLIVYPVGFVATLFTLMPVDSQNIKFRLTLLLFPLANFILSYLMEMHMSSNLSLAVLFSKKFGLEPAKENYEKILENLAKDTSWPIIKA